MARRPPSRWWGPAIIVSYLIGGAIIYLIMRMLDEMSTQESVVGAFSHFAYRYGGRGADLAHDRPGA